MLKILKNFPKKDIFLLLVVVILVVSSVWLDLRMPEYMSEITRLVQTENSEMKSILTSGAYMLLCAVGSLLITVVVGYFTSLISANFSRNIRHKIFAKVEDFGITEIKKFSTSSLITRTTNDVMQIEMLLSMGIILMIKSPVMAVWAILKIIGKSAELSWITAVGVVIIVSTSLTMIKLVIPKFEIIQKLTDRVNGITRENLTGIRVIRAFNAEGYQQNRFEKVNKELTDTQMGNQKIFAIMSPMMNFVMHFQHLGIYVLGAFLIVKAGLMDKITLFSNMVVFSSYGMQVIISFLMLTIIFMIIPRAQVSARRINEVLDSDCVIKSGNFKGQTDLLGEVEFKNVSFKYPDADEYILKNISFKVNKGETIAFIGSTGSGKSTLINLVPRLYDVTDGEILIDGVNVKDYDLEALNNKIGYVPQKAVIFTGSVKDNVAYGSNGKKKPDIEVIKKAVDIAQASEFVLKMNKEYDANIASGGTNISGGQKQRLAIARAIARDPEIYIFDDSFSALDYKTDVTLRKELKKYTKNATNMIVAQRIGTIIHADKIVVLDKGECVGVGTHDELLKTCKVYKEIALSQLSEEELNHA
jgi:ATP-binding cassette subfamily B protein